MSFLSTLSSQMGLPAPTQQGGSDDQDGGAVSKVFLCGRDRKLIIEGRYRFVVIKGKKTGIAKAREMDQKYRAEKREKEAKAKAKAASKSSKSKSKK